MAKFNDHLEAITLKLTSTNILRNAWRALSTVPAAITTASLQFGTNWCWWRREREKYLCCRAFEKIIKLHHYISKSFFFVQVKHVVMVQCFIDSQTVKISKVYLFLKNGLYQEKHIFFPRFFMSRFFCYQVGKSLFIF